MRLQSGSNLGNSEEIMIFSDWILQVGNGKVSEPNGGYVEIDIPEDLLIRDFVDPIQAIVISTYLDLFQNYTSPNFLRCRAILASTIEIVDDINDFITNLLPSIFSFLLLLFFVDIF